MNKKFFLLCTLFMIILLVFVPWNTAKSPDTVEHSSYSVVE